MSSFDLPHRAIPVDPSLGERREEQEEARIDATIRARIAFLEKNYPEGPVRRDFHPRAYGSVVGTTVVRADLPEALRTSLFQPGATYPTILRYSHGSSALKDGDRSKSLIGIGAKLFLEEPLDTYLGEASRTVDLLTTNVPAFPVGTIAENLGGVTAGVGLQRLRFLFRYPRAAFNLLRALHRAEHPFEDSHSASPYLWGAYPSKFRWVFCGSTEVLRELAKSARHDRWLTEALCRHVAEEGLRLSLQVQQDRQGLYRSVIEDAAVDWGDRRIPPVEVAFFTAPPQRIDTEARRINEENLAFNSGRVPPDHRPLGSLNRVRVSTYQAIAEWRRRKNGVPEAEPESVADLDR